jgi:hypothetical protein
MTFGKPRPLRIDEIKDIVQRFAFAAKTLYDVSRPARILCKQLTCLM